MGRIEHICALLEKCKTFADVGCDHGYCTRYMLENNLCDLAYISDISGQSLKKAQNLLSEYIKSGRCKSICCDGLQGFETVPEQVLIAGMGGEEIIKILSRGIPDKFVLQPMKNAPLLRGFLLENGCTITRDDIFKDGKYYFIIKGEKSNNVGGINYSPLETEFGRDSFYNPVFAEYLKEEIAKFNGYLALADTAESACGLNKKINIYGSALKCTQKIF